MDFAINLADGGAGGGSVATGMCDCRAACGLGDYKNDMSICTLRRELAQTQEQCRTLARRLAEQQEKSGGVFGRWL
jgi:hypothetical protein